MCFREELRSLLNRHSMENRSNTPDFILANYMARCLTAFELATTEREVWYGLKCSPGKSMVGVQVLSGTNGENKLNDKTTGSDGNSLAG